MALLQLDVFTDSLRQMTNVKIILPNDAPSFMTQNNPYYNRPTKTLFLLHGYSNGNNFWLTGSDIESLALKYNLAIVCPTGYNSFYLDGKGTGTAYGRWVGEELPAYIHKTFNLSDKPEDTLIGGISMGGFGALHTGLKYPQTFSKIFALSSALIIHEIKNQKEGYDNGSADYDYYTAVFGDLSKLEQSENNPETLVRKLKEENRTIPAVYMACGTEDFLIEPNRQFRNFLHQQGVPVEYAESPGVHDWAFWNQYIEPAILWMLKE